MQTAPKKILWFCSGPPDDSTRAEARACGAMIRDATAYHAGDFVEQCDAVAGAHIPAAYSAFPRHGEVVKPVPEQDYPEQDHPEQNNPEPAPADAPVYAPANAPTPKKRKGDA